MKIPVGDSADVVPSNLAGPNTRTERRVSHVLERPLIDPGFFGGPFLSGGIIEDFPFQGLE